MKSSIFLKPLAIFLLSVAIFFIGRYTGIFVSGLTQKNIIGLFFSRPLDQISLIWDFELCAICLISLALLMAAFFGRLYLILLGINLANLIRRIPEN